LQHHARERHAPRTGGCSVNETTSRSPIAATTTCGNASAATCPGWRASRSVPTGSVTPP
jgi:hypothetical protein